MDKYILRPETLIDIIEKIPRNKVKTVIAELQEAILQAKLSYDIVKIFDPNTKAELPLIEWVDDGKGEIQINHSLAESKSGKRVMVMTTKKTVKEEV